MTTVNETARELVFVSYSHADVVWLERLKTHLKPLERQGVIEVWDDQRIGTGDRWREEIRGALARARVAVLLVSPDFLASNFIAQHELPELLDAEKGLRSRVVWIPVKASNYEATELSEYQAALDPKRTLAEMDGAEADRALVAVSKQIVKVYLEGPSAERGVSSSQGDFIPSANYHKTSYTPTRAEQYFSLVVATGVVCFLGYLIVRNERFADPNLVVLARTLLSLAVAILGGTIPGLLNIGWNPKGVAIRTGGALMLFMLTFWATPNVLPSLVDPDNPPLKNPKNISKPNVMPSAAPFVASAHAHESMAALLVRVVYEGDGNEQRKYYDVVISNMSDEQRFLASFRVRWLYLEGHFNSVDYGRSVRPAEKYAVGLFIDPDRAGELTERLVTVYPPLILPPKNASGPSVTSIRLEVFYTFEGARINWHPNADWDIYYEISSVDDLGSVSPIMSRAWRGGDAPNWVEQFNSRTRRRIGR